ncbi:MAG: hypothetical protein HQ538_01820 [Parcubacteria group bacterium]|nr:hypothetical protein [Parcubacteria group bacterium]
MDKVKLTTQSFRDAGGKEVYPNLEMKGIVSEQLDGNYAYYYAMNHLEEALINRAKQKGFTHVFGIEYSNVNLNIYSATGITHQDNPRSNMPTVTRAVGTGYRPKSK